MRVNEGLLYWQVHLVLLASFSFGHIGRIYCFEEPVAWGSDEENGEEQDGYRACPGKQHLQGV